MTPRVASLAVAVERLPLQNAHGNPGVVIIDKLFDLIDREPATRSNFVYLRDPPGKLPGGRHVSLAAGLRENAPVRRRQCL